MENREKKLNIGVFFGSRSPEHDVSIITAQMVISAFRKLDKYDVTPVYVSKTGKWFISKKLDNIKFFQDQNFEKELAKLDEYLLNLDASKGFLEFQVKQSGFFSKKSIVIDVAFPAIHGSLGEDGTLQGLFEILNVPYTGCGVLASALAMDKIISRKLLEKEGLSVVNYIYFDKKRLEKEEKSVLDEVEKKFTYPLFIKPNRLGSSIGVSKVSSKKELKFAIEVVFQFDDKVIIEETVQNLMEVNCPVIGNDEPITALPEQPIYKQDFQNFEEKYLTKGGTIKKGGQRNIIPAPLSKEKLDEIQELSKKAYTILSCSGISRVDFMVNTASTKVYINEVNTLPGTLHFHLWEASGISREELVDKLVGYALKRYRQNKKFMHTFNSDLVSRYD